MAHLNLAIVIATMSLAAVPAPAKNGGLAELRPFLEQHCFGCHGPEKQKGEHRFDTLGIDLEESETLEVWQNILDQLNLGEMPPKKEPRPKVEEVNPVVATLTAELASAYEKARSTGGQTVLRRLNRHELRNTLRDLLYLNGADYRPDSDGSRLTDNNGNGSVERTGSDPLRFFPEDEQEEGFFNLGDRLVMSDFLLKLTLDAVEETLGQATHLEPKPEAGPRRFAGHLIQNPFNGEHMAERASREANPNYDLMATGYERYGRLAPTELRGGVGISALHRITVEVSAHNQNHPWKEMVTLDAEDPFQLCLNIADTKNGGLAGVTSTPLAIWSVPGDGEKHTYIYEVWIDQTWTPWLGWENGPTDRSFRVESVVEKYFPKSHFPRPDKNTDKEGHEQWALNLAKILHKGGYPGPHLRIHSLSVEPLIDQWPPKSHSALYGSGSGGEAEIRELMIAFAGRAFRRPATADEVEPYVQLVLEQIAEPKGENSGAIKNLSYQVYEGRWSNLPDFSLLTPVAKGELPEGLIDLDIAKRNEHFGMVFEGELEVAQPGAYLFELASDDGARLAVDGKNVVVHDGLHGAELKSGKVRLESGVHVIRVEYFAFGAPNSFRAGWSGPGMPHAKLSVDGLHASPSQNLKGSVPPLINAMQDGYAAILCSPQFLYLKEAPGHLDDFGIATRLSYFLWSSMPDETLLMLAREKRLNDPNELTRQVGRMLEDPKAGAFVRHFTSAWLRLDKLGKMPPSGGDYQFYKNLNVEPMLLRQVTMYFEEVLAANGKIEEFIDSDYTYMNQTLAKWIYRREDIRGERLKRVKLDDPRRGGIFTLPGIMTATANGVDTSPVVRGTWVLENVLGTPPPPPPPDVEPLPSDTREAMTIRQLLSLHRDNDACSSCHNKIDPMGFPFENFDVVGRWRDKYRGANDPIDSSAVMTNGSEIPDIVAFKEMLNERKSLVVRCLTEKMLTYAMGRRLEAADRGEVDRITTELSKNGDRLRDLIELVVRSDIFLRN